ncbi:MAG: hypothetical protein Q4B03_04680 [Lachnospiraceae bacterium]|nr:hypothetical protein [Lachnospiraceae bacterium]
MSLSRERRRLPLYTLMHFLVDLTCIYRLYAQVMPISGGHEHWILLVLLYNFTAFALPGLIGLLADLTDTDDSMAALGCLLAALPAFLSRWGLLTVLCQGVGNGLFHVGAGRKILMESRGRYADSGIFISSGAMGVFLGTLWRTEYNRMFLLGLAAALLVCAGILIAFTLRKRKMAGGAGSHSFLAFSAVEGEESLQVDFLTLSAILILLVVILRSFYGKSVSYDWKDTVLKSFLFVVCIVLGKALGGIIADRWGAAFASVLSLGGAAVTVLFSAHSPLMGCLSILLFNMTMPLTLTLLANCWKGYPGFAFGMLMLALFLGTLPDLLLHDVSLPVWALCLAALLSLACLLMAVFRVDKKITERETL